MEGNFFAELTKSNGRLLKKLNNSAEQVSIGTSIDCDIIIDKNIYPTVSRVQSFIRIIKESETITAYIFDADSRNGTYVNDLRVTNKQELKDGDKISLSKHIHACELNFNYLNTEDQILKPLENYYPDSNKKDARGSSPVKLKETTQKESTKSNTSRLQKNAPINLNSMLAETNKMKNNHEKLVKSDKIENTEVDEKQIISQGNALIMDISNETVQSNPKQTNISIRKTSQDSIDINNTIHNSQKPLEFDSDRDDNDSLFVISEGLIDAKSIAVDSQASQIAYCSDNGYLNLQKFGQSEPFAHTDLGQASTAIRFSKIGELIAIAMQNKDIAIWDISLRNKISVLQGHKLRITDISFSPNSNNLVSCSLDKTIRCWDIRSGKEQKVIRTKGLGATAIDYIQNGTKIISGGKDRVLRLWDYNSMEEARQLSANKINAGIEKICCLDQRNEILVATADHIIHKQSLKAIGIDLSSVNYPRQKSILSICNSGKLLSLLDATGRLQGWNINC